MFFIVEGEHEINCFVSFNDILYASTSKNLFKTKEIALTRTYRLYSKENKEHNSSINKYVELVNVTNNNIIKDILVNMELSTIENIVFNDLTKFIVNQTNEKNNLVNYNIFTEEIITNALFLQLEQNQIVCFSNDEIYKILLYDSLLSTEDCFKNEHIKHYVENILKEKEELLIIFEILTGNIDGTRKYNKKIFGVVDKLLIIEDKEEMKRIIREKYEPTIN